MVGVVSAAPGPVSAPAADDSEVKAATRQVEPGARKVGQGEVVEGVGPTARGIGTTVVEGARFTGEKFKEAGRAAEPPAKRARETVRDGGLRLWPERPELLRPPAR